MSLNFTTAHQKRIIILRTAKRKTKNQKKRRVRDEENDERIAMMLRLEVRT